MPFFRHIHPVFVFTLATLLLTSCAGTWYGDVGMRKSTYTETPNKGSLDTALSQSTGRNIVVTSGDRGAYKLEGTGHQFSFAYETEFLISFFRQYKVNYKVLKYAYSIDGSEPVASDVKLKTEGFEFIPGIKIWLFHPRLVFRYDTAEISSVSGHYVDNNFYIGYGLGTYYEVYNRWLIYLGYDRYFKVAYDPLFNINTVEVSAGVLFRFGGDSETQGNVRFGNPYK